MTEKTDHIESLFKTNYGRMYALAFSLLKCPDAARDVVQDVFADMLCSPTPTPVGPGYLLMGVRNRCLNRLRHLSARQRVEKLLRLDTDFYEEEEDISPESRLAEISRIISNDLPPQCVRTLSLRFDKGMAYKEIAQTSGISEATVFRHLKQALQIIKNNLKF